MIWFLWQCFKSEMYGLLSSSYTFTTISRACPVASGWRIIVFAVIIATCETTNTMWISIAVTSSYITLIGRWAAAPVGNRNTIALSRGNSGCWIGYRRCRFYCKTIWSCEFDEYLHRKNLKLFDVPSQQSALLAQLLPVDEKSVLQLLLPQVKLPAQCESKSQSPPPLLHWLEAEQQLQSVDGTPSHCPAGGAIVVAGALVAPEVSSSRKYNKWWEPFC